MHVSVPAPVAHVRIVEPTEDRHEIDGHPAILPFVMGAKAYASYRDRLWHRNPYCTYCGKKVKFSAATLDHVTPRSRGGLDTPSNLVLCCEKCNQAKDSRSLVEWAADIVQACDSVGQPFAWEGGDE